MTLCDIGLHQVHDREARDFLLELESKPVEGGGSTTTTATAIAFHVSADAGGWS